jgi:glycerol-3-phosphate O-acyltransferase/dihydroxyacetone phosphate acyltransferase
LQPGDKIRLNKSSSAFGVKHIVSDTEAELGSSDDGKSPSMEPQNTWMQFSVLYFVDQSAMFDAVHTALSRGQCLGIFPEGGSHDRTDLLPLKAGVAAIAFGALEKHGINVPIIPVGLTYWSGNKTGGDRFRGRAVVEFGQPIRISPEMATKYKESKRSAYTELLTEVSEGMRSVIVTADNYEDLQLIHTVRRLYKKPAQTVSIRERQDLSRRFALAVRILKNKHNGELPADLVSLRNKLGEYQKQLDYWGLKDYQINKLEVNVFRLLYTFLHGASIFLLASIPSILLNWPVGILAKIWAERGAKQDLAASVVKLKARDVVMSKKIVFSMAAVPMLWSFDALMLYLFLPLSPFAILLLVLCMPLFSYLGVMAVEAGMVDLKDMRPVFMRLVSPSFKQKTREMMEMRAKLQKEVRALVRVYGPPLGALYYDKDLKIDAYKKEHERERNESKDLEDLEEVDGVGEGSGLSSLEPDGNGMRSVPSEFTFSTGAIDVPDERHSFGKTVSDAGLKKTE